MLVGIILVSTIAFLLSGCTQVDESDPLKLSERWVKKNVSQISREIAGFVLADVPLGGRIGGAILEKQINDKLSWSYSEPAKRSENRYMVLANAEVDVTIGIPIVGDKLFTVTLDFELDVDTEVGDVVGWEAKSKSFRISQKES